MLVEVIASQRCRCLKHSVIVTTKVNSLQIFVRILYAYLLSLTLTTTMSDAVLFQILIGTSVVLQSLIGGHDSFQS